MYFKSKKVFFSLAVVVSLYAANDINETKIFLDKYAPSEKTDKYKNTKIWKSYDVNVSSIRAMRDVDADVNSSVSKMIKNLHADEEITKKAQEVNSYVNSKEFAKKLREAKDNILYDKKLNWQKYVPDHLKNTNENETKIGTSVVETEKLFIIISSSIPKVTLKNYFYSLANVNDKVTFVLRGTIGGHKKIMPTLNWIKNLLGDEFEFNIIIDPRITKKYNITKVPAVLYVKDYNLDDEEYWVYYGDIAIEYTLRKINEEARSEFLDDLVRKIGF